MAKLQASYAMAENVFAVTQTPPGVPTRMVARNELFSQRPPALPPPAHDLPDAVYVSSGKPLSGVKIRIVAGEVQLPEAQPGEIQIRTESLFSGYWGTAGFVNNELSADGWYSTGDYGFLAEGNLYVIGRIKDIIIVGGQNIFPEDVEAAVNGIEGIYPGRVAAFGVQDRDLGTEALTVIAELRGEYRPDVARSLQHDIRTRILSTIGIAPRFVFAVPERWIIKSTAGKISRRETHIRFLHEWESLLQIYA